MKTRSMSAHLRQMLLGVSTRKYARSLEPLGPEYAERGTSKSAVSRRFVEVTSKKVDEWLARPLDGIDVIAILIDGIHVDEHVFLVALGIDIEGNKQVLGVREGLDETLTVKRFALPSQLERILSTTNAIENLMGSIRGHTRRAKLIEEPLAPLPNEEMAPELVRYLFGRALHEGAKEDIVVTADHQKAPVFAVRRGGIEPPTRGFSVAHRCSKSSGIKHSFELVVIPA